MGGGGGSDSSSLGDTKSLEQRAKEILQKSQSGRKNVFISFAHEDLNEVNLLRGQAKNKNCDLDFNDRSVKEPYDSDRAEYIRQKLAERINQCSTTVVYLSAEAADSKWVEWEVNKSVELGKTVIATYKGDVAPAAPPKVLSDNKVKIVAWKNLADELCKP